MSTAVKRACDACHRRKVKCDGINPCRNCHASQLTCTYNAIPQKKGPKGSRAKVISELRETQRQTSLSAKVQNRLNGINSPPSSPNLAPTPGLLTSDMVKECIEFFFTNMYTSMPILNRQRLEQQALYVDQSLDTYCVLTALCAFMFLQPGMPMPGGDPYSFENMPGANIVSSTLLLEETLRVRKAFEYSDNPSLNTLVTSYFLFACFHGLDMHEKAWFHLREATTMAHIAGMNKEDTYSSTQYDIIESSRRRRLYWLLFATERAYALQRRRPLTLEATINAPTINDDNTELLPHQLNGFFQKVNLFRAFDNTLLPLWNKTRDECASYFSGLQKSFDDVLPQYLRDEDNQLNEMQMNQQWLKNTSWQLTVASGNSNEAGLPYPYPVDIANDLLPMVNNFPGSLGLPGLSLIEKLLGITCTLTDVLSNQPSRRIPFKVGPREQLHQVLNVLSVLRTGDHRFLPLLLGKVHDFIPTLANPMLQFAPEQPNLGLPPCNIDIFDGFGNAGMGQPACFDYDDNKFSLPGMDELSNDSGSPSGGHSNDMSSPYGNSPSIMSPTGQMDMHHAIPTDFTTLPEMVMSPISHAPPTSLGAPNGMTGQQSQHGHHASIPAFANINQMQGINTGNITSAPNLSMPQQIHMGQGINPGINNGMNNGIGNGMSNGINTNGMSNTMNSPMDSQAMNMGRPPPQRATSFTMGPGPGQPGGPQQIRTVGDFQALQRANSDMPMGGTMNSLGINTHSMGGNPMDYSSLQQQQMQQVQHR